MRRCWCSIGASNCGRGGLGVPSRVVVVGSNPAPRFLRLPCRFLLASVPAVVRVGSRQYVSRSNLIIGTVDGAFEAAHKEEHSSTAHAVCGRECQTMAKDRCVPQLCPVSLVSSGNLYLTIPLLARLSVAATPESENKRKEKEERSVGLDDVVEVLCSGDSAPSAAWLEATVVYVDKANGLYCAACASSVGTFFVGRAQVRLVRTQGQAARCRHDMRG